MTILQNAMEEALQGYIRRSQFLTLAAHRRVRSLFLLVP
jgi:hypothetical protein